MSTRSKPVAQLRGRPTTQEATIKPLVGAMDVPIEQVVPDDTQPRRDWNHAEGRTRLDELANSIREFGILQPLSVRQDDTFADSRPRYVIIAGGRRYAAAQRAGLQTLPVVVRGGASERIRLLQLTENLQRQDLSPLDEARAYQELLDIEHSSAEELAKRLFISGQHVRERLRLLADQVLADAVERRQISATAARDILRLPDEAVLTFKDRVQAGETLQSNDIAVARARLAAEGAINPRRKGGGRPPRAVPAEPLAPPVLPVHEAPQTPTPPSVASRDQASLDLAAAPQDQASLDPATDPQRRESGPDADEARTLAIRVATAIVGELRGERRTIVAEALTTMSGHDRWAVLVLQMVHERLEAE